MAFSRLLDRDYGLSLEKTAGFFRGPFNDCLVGKKDMLEVLPKYLDDWGWQGTLQEFIDLWFKSEHVVADNMIAHVDELRKKGIKCYVATNQEKHRANYMLEEMGFKNHFDKVYASAHLGAQKPSEEFFRKILDEIKLEAENVLFWDDSEEHIEGAKLTGINSELFTDFQNYKKTMKDKYGL